MAFDPQDPTTWPDGGGSASDYRLRIHPVTGEAAWYKKIASECKKDGSPDGLPSFLQKVNYASWALAISVREVKAALSLTAISASILRLISTPAFFRPFMKVE